MKSRFLLSFKLTAQRDAIVFEECVSVLVPLYNHAAYIEQALDSLLSQDYPQLEILVVDDGSSDGGDRLVEQKYTSSGVRLIRQKRNRCGTTRALNTALEQASGEFICWLSADDWFLPQKISQQRQAYARIFSDRPGVLHTAPGYISHDLDYALKSAKLPEAEIRQTFQTQGCVSWQEEAEDPADDLQFFYFFLFNYINGITVFFPRLLVERFGLFSESFPLTQDYEFWFRLAWQGIPFRVMPQAYSYSRMHAGNLERYRSDIPAEAALIVRLYSELSQSEQLRSARLAQGFAPEQTDLFLARIMQFRQIADYELSWLKRARQAGPLDPSWEAEILRLQKQVGNLEPAPQRGDQRLSFLMYLSEATLPSSRWYACLTHLFEAFRAEDPIRILIWVPGSESLETIQQELEKALLEITHYLGTLPDLALELLADMSLSEALAETDLVIPVGAPDQEEAPLLYHAQQTKKSLLYHTSPPELRKYLEAQAPSFPLQGSDRSPQKR